MSIRNQEIYKKRLLWNTGIYKIDGDFDFDTKLEKADKVFNNRRIGRNKYRVHTTADPFLFVKDESLYMFYESKSERKRGEIKAYKTTDLETYEDLGIVMKDENNLSYPFVFKMNNSIFMIPDVHGLFEIRLYKFRNFPYSPRFHKVLLKGNYYDATICPINGIWYLFATSVKGLEIFFTADLEKQPLQPHPQNPISTDPKYRRCGGAIVLINGQHYRLAQDRSVEFGKNLNILKINNIDPDNYQEELYKENFLPGLEKWNRLGGHHLSYVRFKEQSIVATDGKQLDYLVNKWGAFFHKIKTKLSSRRLD